MKLDDIISVNQVVSYWGETEKKFKPATSLKLKLIIDATKSYASTFEKQRVEAKSKFNITDETAPTSEDFLAFKEELNAFLQTEIEFSYPVKINVDELGEETPMREIFMLASAVEQ